MVERLMHNREMETLSREDLDAMQLLKLQKMLSHVAQTNPFYANHWKNAGVDVTKIRNLDDLRSIPMVEKSDFIADQTKHPPFGSRLGDISKIRGRTDIYTTSGTSGQGTEIHACSKQELLIMEEMYRYGFAWAGLTPGDAVLLTLPITMLAGGRVEYQGAVAADLTVYPVGNYDAARKVDHVHRFKPKAMFGSTSYFGHLASLMGDEAKSSSVEVLLTGLEGVGLSFIKSIEEMWGAKAYDRFGCAQIRADFMFSDEAGVGEPDRPGVLFNLDPFIIMEVLDVTTGLPVADGEFGELVITSLYQFDNPAVRNRLRDGAIFRKGGTTNSPRNFHGIEMCSVSRIDDVKKVKGINLYPQAVDDLVFSFGEIQQYEVILTRGNDFTDIATIMLQIKDGSSLSERESLTKRIGAQIKAKMGINFAIEFAEKIEVSDYKARRWKDLRGN
jgi:phenylacetate-CoA ligase